jgi:hypothetical protein
MDIEIKELLDNKSSSPVMIGGAAVTLHRIKEKGQIRMQKFQ